MGGQGARSVSGREGVLSVEAAVLISALFWFSIDFCIVLVGGQRRQERQRAGRRSQCGGCCIDFCIVLV